VPTSAVASEAVDALEVDSAWRRLVDRGGGYEIIHDSPGLEVGVYVLVAPEPDHQNAHTDDELYVVLEGRGELTIEISWLHRRADRRHRQERLLHLDPMPRRRDGTNVQPSVPKTGKRIASSCSPRGRR
jgi:hypothetical protein